MYDTRHAALFLIGCGVCWSL